MATKPRRATPPLENDPDGGPAQHPVFAVTVDIVILTILESTLHVLLIRRGESPYKDAWALPGGFKKPKESLDEAAGRELAEETGVKVATHLSQLGAYGDPGRDRRGNVVTVAYLAVLRDVGELEAGTDAADARLWPVATVLGSGMELAFDHEQIVKDAVKRAGADLETTSLATAFVGPKFTLSELRSVYEAVWETKLDAANFRRSVVDTKSVKPTGQRASPGGEGGRPPELYKPSPAYKAAPPVRRPRSKPKAPGDR